MVKSKGVTFYLSDQVFDKLKDLEVNFHWILMLSNVDKIHALIEFYKENNKS